MDHPDDNQRKCSQIEHSNQRVCIVITIQVSENLTEHSNKYLRSIKISYESVW